MVNAEASLVLVRRAGPGSTGPYIFTLQSYWWSSTELWLLSVGKMISQHADDTQLFLFINPEESNTLQTQTGSENFSLRQTTRLLSRRLQERF